MPLRTATSTLSGFGACFVAVVGDPESEDPKSPKPLVRIAAADDERQQRAEDDQWADRGPAAELLVAEGDLAAQVVHPPRLPLGAVADRLGAPSRRGSDRGRLVGGRAVGVGLGALGGTPGPLAQAAELSRLLKGDEDEHDQAAEGGEAENRTDLLQQVHAQRRILESYWDRAFDPPPGARPALITPTTWPARSVSSPLPINCSSCSSVSSIRAGSSG